LSFLEKWISNINLWNSEIYKLGLDWGVMGNDKIKIVSLHGYNSSHATGFEAAICDAFSGKYDFNCVNLLGHAAGRDVSEFHPIGDVISDGIEKVEKYSDRNTVLIGTSFGAHPILEYLGDGGKALAAIFVKPAVDLGYTFAQYELGDGARMALKMEEAARKYHNGSKENPFNLNIPSLLFAGKKDEIVGGLKFQRERIRGDSLEVVALDGGHCDNNDKDVKAVVGEIRYFLKQVENRGRIVNISPDRIDRAYDEAWDNDSS